MAKKLTRSEKAARLDAFLSNDDNFEYVEYNDPRAVAHRAHLAKLNAKKANVRAARAVETAAFASTFAIGQVVTNGRYDRAGKVEGQVVAIEGQVVTIQRADGSAQKFNASFLHAA